MKKIFIILAVLLCGTFLFASGSAQPGGGGAAGRTRLVVTIAEDLKIDNYQTNVQTRLIEQQANVDLSFIVLPSTDYNNRINLMVMAGGTELSDIICVSPGDAMTYQWAQEGAIVPLTSYYRDPIKSPNIQESYQRAGRNWLADITSPDGEVYGFPFLNQSYYNEIPVKYMYYTPWVEKLGMNFPTTIAEYLGLLRAIANTDLNGNGRRDEIPLTGQFNFNGTDYGRWFNWLMNSFVYTGDSRLLTVNNGKVGVAYNTNEWREGIRFMQNLFAEGLIPTETLTNNVNQIRTLINQEPLIVFSFGSSGAGEMNADNPARSLYDAALPLKGPQGLQYVSYQPSTAGISMVVSKNCRDVDAAFRVGDLMCNEYYGIVQRFGAEGTDWDYIKNIPDAISRFNPTVPGWPLSIVVYDDGNFWGGNTVINAGWRQKGAMVRSYSIVNGWAIPNDSPEDDFVAVGARYQARYQEQGVKPNEVIPKLIFDEQEIGAVTELFNNLQNYVISTTAAFLAGNQSIDTTWNSYIAELNRIGVDRMLAIVQGVYDRMYK